MQEAFLCLMKRCLLDEKEERVKEEERYSREREFYGRGIAVKSTRQVLRTASN